MGAGSGRGGYWDIMCRGESVYAIGLPTVIGKGNGRGGMVYCTFSRMLGTIGGLLRTLR